MGVVFILKRENKILMQQRDGNCKKFPFKWCIPGGTSEKDEKVETTLLREVKEEYDLDLKLEDCTYLMDRNNSADKVYICQVVCNKEPKLQEGLQMKWMTLDEIKKIEIGFHQEDIVLKLEQVI